MLSSSAAKLAHCRQVAEQRSGIARSDIGICEGAQACAGRLPALRFDDVAEAGAFFFELAPQSARRHGAVPGDIFDRRDQVQQPQDELADLAGQAADPAPLELGATLIL